MALPAGVVTFVFTDIEGSTALFHSLGEDFLPVLDDHNRVMRQAIAAHGGVEVKTEGDAFFIAFADPDDALRACASAQRALQAHEWPHGRPVKVRMGLHTGPVEVVDEDYVGLSVAEAARIASAAHGGQVLVSQATLAAAVPDALEPLGFHDLGLHALKDFPEPRHLFQLTHPELPAAFAAPRTLTARSHNLPAHPTPLVGRHDELVHIQDALLHHARLVTLTGPGGIGKSRLTIEAAWTLLSWFREGAWFVSLAPVLSPGDVERAIAGALGISESAGKSLSDALRERLSAGPALLVLDNFEHLLDGATIVADLLAACPPLKVLASSRERLRLRGEHRVALDVLPAGDAVELFAQRARAADPRFNHQGESHTAIERICGRVDNIPLAIELAAAHVAEMTLEELAGQLDRALDVLVEGERDLPARQQTLRATVDWSYRLLSAEQQAVLRSAAAFAGGGSVDALREVHDSECTVAVGELVEKSLMRWEGPGVDHEPRWWMLETIREFASETLAGQPDDERIRTARHVAWFQQLAGQAAERITGPSQAGEMARLNDDLDNLRLALSRLDGDSLVSTAAALARFWFRSGLWSEGRTWLERAMYGATDGVAPAELALVAMSAGLIAQRLGDVERAAEHLDRAVAAARSTGDSALVAETLVQLAELRRVTEDLAGARAAAEEGVALARASASTRMVGSALLSLGTVAYYDGDPDQAMLLWEEALDALERAGDEGLAARVLGNLAILDRARGDLDSARRRHLQQLDIANRLHEPHSAALATFNLATVVLELQEDFPHARQLFSEAMEQFEQIGDRRMHTSALMGLGVATHPTDPAVGRSMVKRARESFLALGHTAGVAEADALLAMKSHVAET